MDVGGMPWLSLRRWLTMVMWWFTVPDLQRLRLMHWLAAVRVGSRLGSG